MENRPKKSLDLPSHLTGIFVKKFLFFSTCFVDHPYQPFEKKINLLSSSFFLLSSSNPNVHLHNIPFCRLGGSASTSTVPQRDNQPFYQKGQKMITGLLPSCEAKDSFVLVGGMKRVPCGDIWDKRYPLPMECIMFVVHVIPNYYIPWQ